MKKNNNPFLSMSLQQRRSLKGYLFFLPLLFGLIFFFIIPIVKSILFSLGDVTSGATGYKITLTGFSAYYDSLKVHTSYRQTVVAAAISVLTKTPLIIIFSFFMASVLNQQFKGKTFFRVVMFLPVILTVMNAQSNSLESSMDSFSSYKSTSGTVAVSFTNQITDWLISAGVGEDFANSLTGLADSVYSVISLSAIQILILLVGMQAVSPSLYEAAKVEGATSWECFWKITFPMVSPMIMTCVIYTVIDSFTSNDNAVMSLISETAFTKLQFSLASAMGWIYFAFIGLLLAVIAIIFSKFIYRYE
ncbi:MAG: carbohydrate ABC transporter permease [Acutalibacteraceae bacterium]